MRKQQQNQNNYGINPQNRNRRNFNKNYEQFASGARKSEWNNTDEHFSADHDNNFDTSSKYNANHATDFSDEGLSSRSHRTNILNGGWDKPGQRSSNQGMRGQFGSGYSDSYDSDLLEKRTGHYGKGPNGYRRSDDRIKEDVCEALYAHNEIDASSIEVMVKDGTVTLSGTVESREFKRQVESVIENFPGVENVQNDLKMTKTNGSTGLPTSLRNSKLA